MVKKRGANPFNSPFDANSTPPVDRSSKPSTPTRSRAATEVKNIPAYAIFNSDDSPSTSPLVERKHGATAEPENFWVCVALPSGQMVKLQGNSSQTTEEFQNSAIGQLGEIISLFQQNVPLSTAQVGGTQLKPDNIIKQEPVISEALQQQQVPTLWISPTLRPRPTYQRHRSGYNEYSNSGPVAVKYVRTLESNAMHASSPGISNSGNYTLPKSPGPRRNRFRDMLEVIPLSFNDLPPGKDKDKTQTILIESMLVQSYAKLKLHDQDDEESSLFKSSIFPTARRIQNKTRLSYSYAVITHLPWPPTTKENFTATFNFPTANVAKTLEVTASTKVQDLLQTLLSSSHVNSIKTKDPNSVIVKFCDFNEFLHPTMEFGMIIRLRKYLQRRKQIKFSIVDTEEIIKSYEIPEALEAIYQPRSTTDLFGLAAPPVPAKNSIPVFDLDYNFQVRILEVINFAEVFPLYVQAADADSNSFMVSVELYHGTHHIVPPIWTEAKPSTKFEEWVEFPSLKINELPRAAKICFTLYVKNYKEMIPLGWVNQQLFDHHNVLKAGISSFPLWLNGKANPLSPCSVNIDSTKPMELAVEFSSYSDQIVIYPSLSRYIYSSEPVQEEDKGIVLSSRLDYLIRQDPLYRMSQNEKNMLWDNRQILRCVPIALPKVLQVVDWTNPQMIIEMLKLMSTWAPLPGSEALQLLDAHYPAREVREYAVNCLRNVPDIDIEDYMLQLVQVLKYEPFHDSPLSRFLLQRALQNRERLGHLLFWFLKAELSSPHISHRYTLLAEAYLYGCGDHLFELTHQTQLVDKLQQIAEAVKSKKKGKTQVLHKELNDLKLDQRVNLPIVPGMSISGFLVEKCKYMDSFTLPLWLECKNTDPFGGPLKMIFKNGDDLRADILTLQMFRIMDKLWQNSGLDLQLSPYMCTATDTEAGMIEVVQNAVTTASIQKEKGVVTGALKKTPLAKWLREKNPSEVEYEEAVDNFVSSLAGYCVATFILGIGDRHNDNIMITTSGHLFHIDFAHILGNVQTWQGIKRERAPFVLTPEFKYVMGKRKSPKFKRFVNLCAQAYLVLRKHANLFISLFSMMLSTGIPELKCDEDINYLRNAFALTKTEKEAGKFFISLIDESLNTKSTQVNFLIHNLAHVTT